MLLLVSVNVCLVLMLLIKQRPKPIEYRLWSLFYVLCLCPLCIYSLLCALHMACMAAPCPKGYTSPAMPLLWAAFLRKKEEFIQGVLFVALLLGAGLSVKNEAENQPCR